MSSWIGEGYIHLDCPLCPSCGVPPGRACGVGFRVAFRPLIVVVLLLILGLLLRLLLLVLVLVGVDLFECWVRPVVLVCCVRI